MHLSVRIGYNLYYQPSDSVEMYFLFSREGKESQVQNTVSDSKWPQNSNSAAIGFFTSFLEEKG